MTRKIPRYLLITVALLALGASLFILMFGGGIVGTDIVINGASKTQQQTIEQYSWFQAQGWWGVAVLGIYAALYYAPLHFFQRERPITAAVFGAATLMLTVLAGFSIGQAYLPAALLLLVALPLVAFRSSNT